MIQLISHSLRSIEHPTLSQAAIDPRLSSTFSNPCRFRMEAAMMARLPLPQKVITG